MLGFRCAKGDWSGALSILDNNLASGLIDKALYKTLTFGVSAFYTGVAAMQVGQDLRAENPAHAFATRDEGDLRFPPGRLGTNYVIALEDFFFVYPTKLREYQARYRGSFLHGGISPEEMILPVALLTPR